MLVGHFFYDPLLGGRGEGFPLSGASWLRNIVLINSTVILLGAAKVIQLYFQLLDSRATQEQQRPAQSGSKEDDYIEVKSNRRIHRLRISDILYIEGMGNYITYVTVDRRKTVVYSSLKSAQAALPHFFVRLNRSYLVNRHHISAYDSDTVTVAFKTITRGKDISDKALQGE